MWIVLGSAKPPLLISSPEGSTLSPAASIFNNEEAVIIVDHAEAVDQEMVVRSRHARGDAGVDQIRPAKQIDKAIAGGKIDPRLPFRISHPRRAHLCNGHGRSLH
jgi:hypothetical protein